jgi:Poly(A) polymerase catalytic subunit
MSEYKKKTITCDKKMSFQECELAILRMAVDLAQEKVGKRVINSPEVQEMIQILEDFLKKKNLVCYGGQSINEELPEEDRFYNKDVDIPDYDFYSPNALDDAKELADLYYKKGYKECEAKAGQHHGTYKVYVNFIPIADISYMPKELFQIIKSEAIRIHGILYAPPTFLKMGMYLELSRPIGDNTRFEKVFKRLALLNKAYPLTSLQCETMDFQRDLTENRSEEDEIYETVKNTLVHQGVVFFGGYAISLYSQYMPKNLQKKLEKVPDFDVISNDPETCAEIVKERLKDKGIKQVKVVKHAAVGEIVPLHYEVRVGKDSIAFIYEPVACHSYNVISIEGQKVRVATIDTMLSFYLAFLYTNRPYYQQFSDRILCMAKFLFDVQQKNRLAQKGLLKRFSILCYGHQPSVEEMRAEKSKKFKELKDKKGTREYEEWFFNYRPDQEEKKSSITTKTSKPSKNSKSTKKKGKKTVKKVVNPYNKSKKNRFLHF